MDVRKVDAKHATKLSIARHYLHRKSSAVHAFGLFVKNEMVGVIIFGVPASRHVQKGACPSNPDLVVELNRLWVDDKMPRNTESWFIARALKQLPPLIVVSYADTTRGHIGFVYRAANFHYAGWTDMDRKTPRYDYLCEGKHTRDAFRGGLGVNSMKVRRFPKVRYWVATGNHRDRKKLSALCGWASLDWKKTPPPALQSVEVA